MIEIKGLSKSYGPKQVLHELDLTLERGKVYGIVGENGAGKTTLFKCIAGLEPYSGDIYSEWLPLKNVLGFLSTHPLFLSRITGWEYLKLMCIARDKKTEDFEARNVFELPLDQYAATYSTGMKKKLALMAVLLQGNEVFILDEPFNGVDIHSNLLITEIIHELKAKNKIVLISSHIFSTLSETCDEIHVLKAGRFVKQVLPEDFDALDQEMKNYIVGDKVNQLNIQ